MALVTLRETVGPSGGSRDTPHCGWAPVCGLPPATAASGNWSSHFPFSFNLILKAPNAHLLLFRCGVISHHGSSRPASQEPGPWSLEPGRSRKQDLGAHSLPQPGMGFSSGNGLWKFEATELLHRKPA